MVFKKWHRINLGKKNRLGKPRSEESKRKIAEAKNCRKLSEEHRRKTSETLKYRRNHYSEDWHI